MSEQPTEEDYAKGLRKQQMVMEFDMATWRVRTSPPLSFLFPSRHLTLLPQRAIEVFNITEPMIPQRPKSTMRIGGKWYG